MEETQNDSLILGDYAERAYLAYAMSVVKGRALPEVADGQKPVQRRILFAMNEMHLAAGAKPVKSARVVGEILGKYHPHGDSSAYEAMVRMAQDFTLRYPLIDGIGNFGSRDGDGAAAMRYTEARLTPIARLLLSELDMGTVDFVPNYDGAFQEPLLLPARLPVILLNGASGIAVGMATEIPPHNLKEVTAAAVALLKNPQLCCEDLMAYLPAPDFTGGGQIITPPADIAQIYASGKGSLRVRARFAVEKLARGQWRVAVTQLPPGVSAQKILHQIEDLTNPKPKAGRKVLSQEQQNARALILSLIERVRDESDSAAPVRLVIEPKSSRLDAAEMMATLMAQTDLEINVPVNLVMMGNNGRPAQKNLKSILDEWLDFRTATVTRRLQHRLAQVDKRIHILEGRMTVFLHIDEVIRVIRESDNPKSELMAAFALSEIQADDILEIRLRQLARLEWLKLEGELENLRREHAELTAILGDETAKKRLIIREMQADAAEFGDERRTLVQTAERAVAAQSTADEAVTLIVSQQGWIRARSGHGLDIGQTVFKEGDALQQVLEGRSIWSVIVLDTHGRTYSIDAADIPGGRGMGVPLTSLIELQNGAQIAGVLTGLPESRYLLAGTGGYGFIATLAQMHSRVKNGKAVMTLNANETALPPVPLPENTESLHVLLATDEPRLLAFALDEIKSMGKGRGLQLISLPEDVKLAQVLVTGGAEYFLDSVGVRGGQYTDTLKTADIAGKRGKRGKPLKLSGSLKGIRAKENAQTLPENPGETLP